MSREGKKEESVYPSLCRDNVGEEKASFLFFLGLLAFFSDSRPTRHRNCRQRLARTRDGGRSRNGADLQTPRAAPPRRCQTGLEVFPRRASNLEAAAAAVTASV
ncbi:hypothetical protein MTO96_035128 [Rhipicephalus appendiculatus]